MKFFPLFVMFACCLASPAIGQDVLTEKGGYSTNVGGEHCFIFVLNNRPNDLQELRTGITKYIWKYHPSDKLKITQISIDGDLKDVPLIHVAGFQDKAQAMAFFQGLKQNKPDFLQMGMTKDYFPLSKANYDYVVRNKSLNGYRVFFDQNYLR